MRPLVRDPQSCVDRLRALHRMVQRLGCPGVVLLISFVPLFYRGPSLAPARFYRGVLRSAVKIGLTSTRSGCWLSLFRSQVDTFVSHRQ